MEKDIEPVPLQVVFQGGGAKLSLLMAVCSVLEKFEQEEKRIKITRVAGSSAGAIAAVMLASAKSADFYSYHLKQVAENHLNKIKTSKWLGGFRVVRGKPYFDALNLEDFFEELVCRNGGPKTVADLRIPAQLYFTDLYSLESRSCPNDEPLPKALAKSCRFPFAFVGYGMGNTEVDGGLAHNLPVDKLKNDETSMGPVIAISFSQEFATAEQTNILSYTQQLFSAAIQSGVSRSEAILGKQNVFPIESEIGTFDFNKALTDGLGAHYKLVAGQFATWLSEWLKKFGPIKPVVTQHAKRLVRPPLSNVPMSPAVVRELDERLKTRPYIRALSASNIETAILDHDGKHLNKFRSRALLTCHIEQPTNLLQFSFQIGPGSFTAANLGCAMVDSKGSSLSFTPHVQEVSKPQDLLRSFRVYFLFDQALAPDSPGQPYVVEYQYECDEPYPHLGKSPDYSTFFGLQGGIEEATLVIAFPRSKLKPHTTALDISEANTTKLDAIGCKLDFGESLVPSEEMPINRFLDSLNLDHPLENYFLVGRRVTNLKQGQGFGIIIE